MGDDPVLDPAPDLGDVGVVGQLDGQPQRAGAVLDQAGGGTDAPAQRPRLLLDRVGERPGVDDGAPLAIVAGQVQPADPVGVQLGERSVQRFGVKP